ncbi:MAG: alkaline phosphatase family protein [Gammaproteobacteria bacterium]|nr:alkaline phosphatase family protein [Gammaproteobacteria bacterium]
MRTGNIVKLSALKSKMLNLPLLIITAVMLITSPLASDAKEVNRDIDLVIQITSDMLKGEMPFKYYDKLTGGYKYLLDNGVSYTNAHYQHSTTFTAVGHAVLSTGAPAAEHGLAGNDWADRVTGERMYCIMDASSKHLESSSLKGTSPRNLTATTISDEIKLSNGGKPKVFGIGIKDRGAIIPAGRLGKAIYYNPGTGNFITSDYYYDQMPDWLVSFNKSGAKDLI